MRSKAEPQHDFPSSLNGGFCLCLALWPFLVKTLALVSRPTLQLKWSFRCWLVRVMQFGTQKPGRWLLYESLKVTGWTLDNFTVALISVFDKNLVFRKINPLPSFIIVIKARDFYLCLMYTVLLAVYFPSAIFIFLVVLLGWLRTFWVL